MSGDIHLPFSDTNECKHVQDCCNGNISGELSLLYDAPCASSCIAATECTLCLIRGLAFRRLMKPILNHPKSLYGENCQFCALGEDILLPIPIFSEFDKTMMCKAASNLTQVSYFDGGLIIKRGQVGTNFYIIKEGMLRFHDFGGRVMLRRKK